MMLLGSWRPWLGLFVAYASRRYPRQQSINARVEKQINDHPTFFKVCMILDALFIALVCALIIGAFILNLMKVFL